MLKKSLINRLYKYNMHIGSIASINSKLNYYILGNRFGFSIIDLNKSFILLKKTIFFLNQLSINNGSLLFYYSNYSNLNIIYKCILLSICKSSNQQMITYNWVYGSIGNYYFSFYSLIKELTSLWLKRHNYLFNFDTKRNQYYSFNFENDKFELFEYLFLTKWKLKKNKNYNKNKNKHKGIKIKISPYSKWYKKWITSTSTYKFWSFQSSSHKHSNFLKKLCLNDINNIWKKKKLLSFKFLFIKLYYYIYAKKKDSFSYNNIETNNVKYNYLHTKFKSYWRFMLYFKYFNNYYNLPDALFSIYPNKNNLPIKEYSSVSLVSIGLVDTDCDTRGINYPIICNDDSLMIVIFYFTLFSNIFIDSKVNIHKMLCTNI